ncbi:MAG: N-acetyltransferase [Mogibacterium sp.]|nr:N-acetyltransferase [Mogibacterium sp.]
MFTIEDNRIYMQDDMGKVVAEITFPETSEGVFEIDRTFVDESLRGQGMASKLVRAAVDEIKSRGGKVEATCSYAVKWLEKNERGTI